MADVGQADSALEHRLHLVPSLSLRVENQPVLGMHLDGTPEIIRNQPFSEWENVFCTSAMTAAAVD